MDPVKYGGALACKPPICTGCLGPVASSEARLKCQKELRWGQIINYRVKSQWHRHVNLLELQIRA